jgi:hypothetical protein
MVSPSLSAVAEFGRTNSSAACVNPPTPPSGGGGEPPAEPESPAATLTLGKLKLNKKKGTAKLTATVSGAGSLKLTGRGLKSVVKQAVGAGNVVLPVKPKGKTKAKLAATGKARVKVTVSFTPSSGAAISQKMTAKLRLKL